MIIRRMGESITLQAGEQHAGGDRLELAQDFFGAASLARV
jgi:hypothetical protein